MTCNSEIKTLVEVEKKEQELIHNPKYKKRYFKDNCEYFGFMKRHPECRIDKVMCQDHKIIIYHSQKIIRPKSNLEETMENPPKEKTKKLGKMWKFL